MTDVVVPREGPLSWRPSKELRARLTAEAERRGMPLGRLIEELCLAGLAEEAEPWRPSTRLAEPVLPEKGAMPEPLVEAVVAAAAKGGSVVKASQVCPREHYHRPGRYCTTCDKTSR